MARQSDNTVTTALIIAGAAAALIGLPVLADRWRSAPEAKSGALRSTAGRTVGPSPASWRTQAGARTTKRYFADNDVQDAALEYWWGSYMYRTDPAFQAAVTTIEFGPADTEEEVRRVTTDPKKVSDAIWSAEHLRSTKSWGPRAVIEQALSERRTSQAEVDRAFKALQTEHPNTPDWAVYAKIGKYQERPIRTSV